MVTELVFLAPCGRPSARSERALFRALKAFGASIWGCYKRPLGDIGASALDLILTTFDHPDFTNLVHLGFKL